jgi:hypothetical protein
MDPDDRKLLAILAAAGAILTGAGILISKLLSPRPVPAPPRQRPGRRGGKSEPSRGAQRRTGRRRRVADPRAFISFDFDHDEKQRMLFAGQGKTNSPTTFTIGDWSSKEVLAQSDWEAKIKDKIGRCNMVIVLVGRFMGSATGVVKEIAMAKELDVPVFGVYVDGAGSTSALPTGLQRNRTIAWTWPGIASAIDQMMTEGKNKK